MESNQRKKIGKRGVTMIEVLIALALLTTALLLGVYPTMWAISRQSYLASHERIARKFALDQFDIFRWYPWSQVNGGALSNGGGAPPADCSLPGGFTNQYDAFIIHSAKISGMTFRRTWTVTPNPGGDIVDAQVWVYWREGSECKQISLNSKVTCNRGDYPITAANFCGP